MRRCIRCVKARRHPVGTHGLCVRPRQWLQRPDTRFAVLQRTHRPSVPTAVTRIATRSIFPTLETFISYVGKKNFQRWKNKFPPLEKMISSVGNFIFQAWKVFGKFTYYPRPASESI